MRRRRDEDSGGGETEVGGVDKELIFSGSDLVPIRYVGIWK